MSDPIKFESIDVSMSSSLQGTRANPQSDSPFRILIMGDFSGRANRGLESQGPDLGQRKLHRVDRDNMDTVMEKMAVALSLDAAGTEAPPVDLSFTEMDDFHPDQIYNGIEIIF